MNPERWKQIDQIFHAALNRDPSARASFLADACKDDESLRTEIEALIASHEKESSLFDSPASDLAAEFLGKDQKDKIAHYQILKKIGSGGMGEVYLAEDTRLNRKVALKLLPSEFTNDLDRVRRFEREAKTASALNHPNILTIYDIGQFDSSSFIASEYIDGETLRQRMRESKMSLKEILAISIQVAEALDAAHSAGIIHRDIKPENIMIRNDGYIKVLDFGLAKLTQTKKPSVSSQLETLPKTEIGVVLGTIRYMSPEQARGLSIDARSDLFSFGVVLYEMISGRVPFDGATASDVIAAILEKNPPPLQTIGEKPDELQWIVSKALAKDRDERYQNVKDLLTDLKRLRKRIEIDEGIKYSDPSTIIQPAHKKPNTLISIAVVLVLVAGIIFLFLRTRPKDVASRKLPFNRIKITRLTANGSSWGGVISPDGKYIAYAWESEDHQQTLFLRQLNADTEIPILKLPEGNYLYDWRFSSDGEYIFYIIGITGKDMTSLYKLPALGGISREIIDDIQSIPTFSPDNQRMAFLRFSKDECSIVITRTDGSEPKKLRNVKLSDQYGPPKWSPDGKTIASILYTNSKNNYGRQLMQIDVKDGSQRALFNEKWASESGQDLEWLPDGSGLLLTKERENEGMRQIYGMYLNGGLTSITNDFNDYTGLSLSADLNQIVTTQRSFNSNIWVAPSDHLETGRYITSGSLTQDGAMGLSWTPDNKIVFSSKEPIGGDQLYIVNADGKARKKITTGKDNKYWPVFSRDGRYIAYNTQENDSFKIWRMDNDGGNLKVLSGRNKVRWPRLSPDSQWIIFSTFGNEKQELVRLSMKDEKETVLTSHRYIYGASISPDGKQIAYVYLEHEFDQDLILNIISSDGGPATKTIHLEKDAYTANRMHWTPDGTGIAYLHFEKGTSNIHIQPIDGSSPLPLTNFKDENITNFSWSLDGKQIAYSRGKDNYDIVLIQNVP